jgi:hypothetical protein
MRGILHGEVILGGKNANIGTVSGNLEDDMIVRTLICALVLIVSTTNSFQGTCH